MTVAEAKSQVIAMMTAQLEEAGLDEKLIDTRSPDGDPGKFTLSRLPARVVPPFNDSMVSIDRGWFLVGDELPFIQRGRFHYYVIAISDRGNVTVAHYHICDYRTMRDYVLSLRDYVVRNPEVIDISADSAGYAEDRFESGDTADVLFLSGQEICVIEIEEEGTPQHQARYCERSEAVSGLYRRERDGSRRSEATSSRGGLRPELREDALDGQAVSCRAHYRQRKPAVRVSGRPVERGA